MAGINPVGAQNVQAFNPVNQANPGAGNAQLGNQPVRVGNGHAITRAVASFANGIRNIVNHAASGLRSLANRVHNAVSHAIEDIRANHELRQQRHNQNQLYSAGRAFVRAIADGNPATALTALGRMQRFAERLSQNEPVDQRTERIILRHEMAYLDALDHQDNAQAENFRRNVENPQLVQDMLTRLNQVGDLDYVLYRNGMGPEPSRIKTHPKREFYENLLNRLIA